ncbi:flagellar assembly protein FliW [bacterium]|nr:flagellar assembly protein FliW [bacterium]
MKIDTTRFGQIEVPEETVLNLPDGVLGLCETKRYVLLEHDSEGTPFKWLQAVDNPDLAFIVMDPNLVVEDYRVEFEEETAEKLGVEKPGADLAMMAIVNIPRENPIAMTVNLRAPIVVQVQKRVGWQIVLPDEDYPIRHRLFPDPEKD